LFRGDVVGEGFDLEWFDYISRSVRSFTLTRDKVIYNWVQISHYKLVV